MAVGEYVATVHMIIIPTLNQQSVKKSKGYSPAPPSAHCTHVNRQYECQWWGGGASRPLCWYPREDPDVPPGLLHCRRGEGAQAERGREATCLHREDDPQGPCRHPSWRGNVSARHRDREKHSVIVDEGLPGKDNHYRRSQAIDHHTCWPDTSAEGERLIIPLHYMYAVHILKHDVIRGVSGNREM